MRAGTRLKAVAIVVLVFPLTGIASDTDLSDLRAIQAQFEDAKYEMQKQVWELRQQLIKSEIDADYLILDDIKQQHLRGIKKMPTDPLKCLTDNIYYEAGFEPYEGKVAVAQVTMNRVADSLGGDTVCQVVYFRKRGGARNKIQAAFSWTLGWHWRAHGKSREAYKECEAIAREVLAGRLHSEIIGNDVEFYHADYIKAAWAPNHEQVAQIGHHIFYQ